MAIIPFSHPLLSYPLFFHSYKCTDVCNDVHLSYVSWGNFFCFLCIFNKRYFAFKSHSKKISVIKSDQYVSRTTCLAHEVNVCCISEKHCILLQSHIDQHFQSLIALSLKVNHLILVEMFLYSSDSDLLSWIF